MLVRKEAVFVVVEESCRDEEDYERLCATEDSYLPKVRRSEEVGFVVLRVAISKDLLS